MQVLYLFYGSYLGIWFGEPGAEQGDRTCALTWACYLMMTDRIQEGAQNDQLIPTLKLQFLPGIL